MEKLAVGAHQAWVTKKTLKYLTKLGIPCVNYYPDFRFSYRDVEEETFVYYSHFFTTKTFQLEYLRARLGRDRVSYLPHGYVPDCHYPPKDGDQACHSYDTDIAYVGNHTPYKERWLSAVRRRLPHRSMRIYGHRWREAVKDEILKECIVGRPADGADYARAVHSARICLAIHMGVADDTGWHDLTSARTFEIPACKGFMLHIDNSEVRSLFTPGEEIAVFADVDDLCETIEFYLAHDELRKEMVERAHRRCVPAYSYDERAKVIARWIEENTGQN